MKYVDDFIDLLSAVSSSDSITSESPHLVSFSVSESTIDTQIPIGGDYVIQGAPLRALNQATEIAPTYSAIPMFSNFLEAKNTANTQLTLDQIASPFIAINESAGGSGSRSFAAPLDAVVAIADSDGRFCSGTLIDTNLVLTARHCFVSSSDQVIFGDTINTPTFTADIESVVLPAGEQQGGVWFDGDDIALLTLSQDIPTSVAQPLPLTTATDSLLGQTASISGYGNNGVGTEIVNGDEEFLEDFDGFRWGGQNVLDHYGEFAGGENLFLADFDSETNATNSLGSSYGSESDPLPLEAMITYGDSGGPLLVDSNGQLAVAGVASGGLVFGEFYGAVGFWTGVGRFSQPIANAGGIFVEGIEPSNGNDGGSGGDNVQLPDNDDHANDVGDSATLLQFETANGRLTAREDGFIGFESSLVEQDVFRFTTTITGRIILDARATSGGLDTELRIFDATGNLIDTNDNAATPATNNPLDSQLILRNMPAGEYFAAVNAVDGSNGSYRLAVRSRASNAVTEPGDSFGTAGRIFLGSETTTFVRSEIDTRLYPLIGIA